MSKDNEKNNAIKIAELSKKIHERYHTKRIKENTRRYAISHPIKVWATLTLCYHKLKKISVQTTIRDLELLAEMTEKCKYCGAVLEYGARKDSRKTWNPKSASLDMIDNTRPLTMDNVQIICRLCNTAKNKLQFDEFKDWVKKVYFNLWC